MKNISYWLDTPYTARPNLATDSEAEVVVIGGGITGISVAYHCATQGLKTVLIEKGEIASGSAGKNGGMVVGSLAIDFCEAVEKFGAEKATEAWSRVLQAREYVASLIGKEEIPCDFSRGGSLYLAANPDEKEWLQKELAQKQAAGFSGTLLGGEDIAASRSVVAGLYTEGDCLLHPVQFIRGLAVVAEKAGLRIYENTPALSYTKNSVTTPNGIITAQKVVLAIESGTETPEEECVIVGQLAIVTAPLSEKTITAMDWRTGGMLWTSGTQYVSARKIGNRLFACGSLSAKPSFEEIELARTKLLGSITNIWSDIKTEDLPISHEWNGLMLFPKRQLPYITERDGRYEIYAHGGNGLTNGIMTGKLLAESFQGKEIPALYRK